jgi:hypothetical protein
MGDCTGQGKAGNGTVFNPNFNPIFKVFQGRATDCSIVGQYDVNGIQQNERNDHGRRCGFCWPVAFFCLS